MRVGLLAFACFDLGDGGLDQPGALGVGEHGQPALPDFTASWSLWSPRWTCYFTPKICSSLPGGGKIGPSTAGYAPAPETARRGLTSVSACASRNIDMRAAI